MLSLQRLSAWLFVPVLLLSGVAPLRAQPAPAAEIQDSLLRLNELGTVLTVAAHPDDERSDLIAYFSLGRHMRAAYLSVTRGEGGQNVLGPEQGAALGLIRTQELLDARRIDGGSQFFTRAIDFGFSKTAAEAMAIWGHDAVLSDMVWAIRSYRPDVILTSFSGTPADGHGHHQASAILAKEAFEAAGDPARFPGQLRYVQPWKAAKFARGGGFGGRGPAPVAAPGVPATAAAPANAAAPAAGRGGRGGRGNGAGRGPAASDAQPVAPTVEVDTSGYDPLHGYSFSQLATISRSQHRSQGLGAMGVGGGMNGGRGGFFGAQAPTAPVPDVFDGIEHSWKRFPGGAAIDAILSEAIREFDWQHPDRTIPLLVKARPLIAAIDDPLARLKLADLDETIAKCDGIWADAQAREGNVTPGSHVPVSLTVVARESAPIAVQSIAPENLWSGKPWTPDAAAPQRIPDYDLAIPADQPYSQPYWLRQPPRNGAYVVDNQQLIGLPESPVEQMRIRLTVAGTPIELVRPILYRYNDRLEGEKVRPLTVVPPVAVNLPLSPDDVANEPLLFPSRAARALRVTLKAETANAEGSLRLDVPTGWKAEPASQPFHLAAIDDLQELTFQVTPPAAEGAGMLHAVASVAGKDVAVGMASISYEHIPQQILFPPSDVKLERSDVAITAHKIAYIMGAGDEEPDALRQLGLDVTLLDEADLRAGDLSRFDAIVAGVRAYNVRPDLRAYQSRLMDYVRNGGTYVVQNVRENVPDIGPYPFTISGGNAARITDETSPVAFTHPDSPLLLRPNKIGPRDFEGWVQERGTYFLTEWDPRYETVLSANDPGEKPLDGGEIWTRYGKGVFIYTAYVWFRELPAGVPGAFRLFANLLSAK
jgi:LmbE family N-acetylglucosaminyl deacetylase